MKYFLSWVLFFLSATATSAQTKADEEAVRNLPWAFCEAWAKHDGHELARIMADDADFAMVMIAEKRNNHWLVVVGQNTNAMLGIPPELQDIKTPIAIRATSPTQQ